MDRAQVQASADGVSDEVRDSALRKTGLKFSMTALLSTFSPQRWNSFPSTSKATTAEGNRLSRRNTHSSVKPESGSDDIAEVAPGICQKEEGQEEVKSTKLHPDKLTSQRFGKKALAEIWLGVVEQQSGTAKNSNMSHLLGDLPTTKKRNKGESMESDQKRSLPVNLHGCPPSAQLGYANNHRNSAHQHSATRDQHARLDSSNATQHASMDAFWQECCLRSDVLSGGLLQDLQLQASDASGCQRPYPGLRSSGPYLPGQTDFSALTGSLLMSFSTPDPPPCQHAPAQDERAVSGNSDVDREARAAELEWWGAISTELGVVFNCDGQLELDQKKGLLRGVFPTVLP